MCLELLCNWATFFRARRAYYSNIVDMYEILESEGIVVGSGAVAGVEGAVVGLGVGEKSGGGQVQSTGAR